MANTHSLDLESGSSQYASIADASQTGLDLSTIGTLECWVKFESLPSSGNRVGIIVKHDDTAGAASHGYILDFLNNAGTYVFNGFIGDSAGDYDYYRWAFTPTPGQWYHVALTINTGNASASTLELFIDGASQGNGSAVIANNISTINNNSRPLVIGAWPTPGDYFDGLIDDVRIWNDVRTSTEINDNMNVELNGNEAGLVAYYKLNNNYLDETSNNNDLTASGSPVFSTDIPFIGIATHFPFPSHFNP